MRKQVLTFHIFLLFIACAAGCDAFGLGKNTPEPMLEPRQAEEFGYEFQRLLMDMKEPGGRVLLSTDGNLRIYGPAQIAAPSSGPFAWTLLHNPNEQWTVRILWQGQAQNTVLDTTDVSLGRTEVILRSLSLANQSSDDTLTLSFRSGTRVKDVNVPVRGLGARLAVDGPSVIYLPRPDATAADRALFGRQSFQWTVSNPQSQQVSVAFTGNAQPAVPAGAAAAQTRVIQLPGTGFTQPGSFKIVVRDANALPLASKDVDVRFMPLEQQGWVQATFTIEDQLSAQKNFGATFAKCFYCINVTLTNKYDKPISVQAASIKLPVDFISRLRRAPGAIAIDDMRRLHHAINYKEYLIEYEGATYVVFNAPRVPMNFTAVLSAFEYDRRHDPRQVFINILRGAGVIAAGVPAFSSVGESYAPITSFIQGPVTETLSSFLLDDLLAHLGFLNANALHDSITIERQSSVQKYVFFPRGDIYAAWGLELPVRIMALRQQQSADLDAVVQVEQQSAEVKK